MPRRDLAAPRPARTSGIAGFAGVLADPSRAAMLDALLDGEAHPIGRLARRAAITPATASSHLQRLVEAGLASVEQVGRERRVRLAGPDAAELLERIAALAGPGGHATGIDHLRFARTCYDHLAGLLGVAVATRLVELGWLYRTTDTFEPATPLFDWLESHGQPIERAAIRPLSRACLDWTERTPHLAGRAGAAVARVFFVQRWVARIPDTRALRLSPRGRTCLASELGIRLPGRVGSKVA
ncbi:MAG TPA: winged helix-turn-helix domain-containing protein [Kofleriaceae bacterium]